jgi:hypothetical protein
LVTPAGAPRVLHDPVVLTGGGVVTVSDNEGSVIEISSTSSIEDTGLVGLESESGSVNTDRDGLDGNSSLHGSDVVTGGGTLGGDNELRSLGLAVSACTSGSGVRVVSLSHGLGVHAAATSRVVKVSPGGETSIAGLVLEELVITIEELLLGVRGEGVTLDLPDTFEASGSGECPARTALSLILNRGDGSGGDPVNGGSGLNVLERGVLNVVLLSGLGSTEELLVFSSGPGGHLVVSKFVRGLSGVVLFDEGVHSVEVGHSEVVLLDGSVGETELSNVSEEDGVGGGNSDGKSGSKEFHLFSI